MRYLFGALLLLAFLVAPIMAPHHAFAITPEEQLSDPALEARARALSAELRCLVCQNQSIEDSDADLAKDLRRTVRDQLTQGQSDDAILAYLQQTYGDFVLLKPPVSSATYGLWFAPIGFVGLAIVLFIISRRQTAPANDEEMAPADSALSGDAPSYEAKISRPMMWSFLGLIVVVTIALYAVLGRPDLASQPLAERGEERRIEEEKQAAETAQTTAALAKAQEAVAQDPQSVEAHLSLALIQAKLLNYDAEIASLRTALSLANDAPAIKSMLAESMSRKADGQIILPARALIDEVLRDVPNEPRALFMAGLAAYQDEAYERATAYWLQLWQSAPDNTPWRGLARRNIASAAEAGGFAEPEALGQADGPDAEAMAAMANASEDEQKEMIGAMVEGLEARLNEAGGTAQEWQRLVQARRVLGNQDDLLRALASASDAQSRSKDAQLALLGFLFEEDLLGQNMTDAEQALGHLRALDETGLEYLFFAGHMARLDGRTDVAIAFWSALRKALPEDGPLAAQINAQISQLKAQ